MNNSKHLLVYNIKIIALCPILIKICLIGTLFNPRELISNCWQCLLVNWNGSSVNRRPPSAVLSDWHLNFACLCHRSHSWTNQKGWFISSNSGEQEEHAISFDTSFPLSCLDHSSFPPFLFSDGFLLLGLHVHLGSRALLYKELNEKILCKEAEGRLWASHLSS